MLPDSDTIVCSNSQLRKAKAIIFKREFMSLYVLSIGGFLRSIYASIYNYLSSPGKKKRLFELFYKPGGEGIKKSINLALCDYI